MTDLAALGLRIESQEAEIADRRLDSFEASAQRAETATDSLAAAARGLGNALLPTLTSIDASVRELLELQRIQQGVVGASVQQVAATQAVARETAEATAAVSFYSASFRTTQATMGGAAEAARRWTAEIGEADAHVQAYRRHIDQLNAAMAQQDSHVVAYRQHLAALPPVIGQADAHMVAYRNQIGRVGTGLKLTAQDGLNFSRQMADIGVTAAMGMNPLMIALQQGPQLFDILQMTAMRSGMSIRATMAATGAVVWTALAPLLPLIAAIAAAGAVVFGGFALSARAAREASGDLTAGMGLTEGQMKRLKDEGVETGVTVGDVFRGLGTTIKEGFFAVFGDQIDWLARKWDEAMDALWRGMIWATKQISGGFLGALYTIRDTWRMLPAVLGDAAVTTANLVLGAIESMINGGVRLLNGLISKANQAAARMGMSLIPELDEARIGRLENQYAGAMREFGAQAGRSFAQGMTDASAGVDRVASRLVENIIASGQARIRAAAGDAEEARTGTGGRDRPDREVQKLEAFRRPAIQDLRAGMPLVDEALPLREIADELRLIDELARDAARGMASAFGEAGRAMGDLMTVMTGYESRLAEIALAQKEGRLTEAQAIREQAAAQIQSYGDMAAAARGFFREGSDGYKAMLAVEQVYRAYQFASAIQAMALGGQETAFTLGQNAIRAASHGVVAVARAIASLPFPMNLVAGAATIAALAAIGVKIAGGGGGGSRGSGDDEGPDHSTNAVRSYSAMDAQARDQATSAIASKVEIRVTADRDGLNAYVASTAQKEAFGVAAPMVAAAAAGTKRDVMDTLNARQVGNRKISV